MSGAVSYHAGLCAEDRVAAEYSRRGAAIVGRRWRGRGGEIDVIAREGSALVFIEVKASRSHARAAERIGARQIARLYDAAAEYVATEPDGLNTEMRFDVALMDRTGAIEIRENAFM
ncbi:YraN family protein [Oceaniglobus roseus]|uniref:YraN family protein n=1 Tax=Oceaniglobus roseus TaxID=1737570 RepID=UPI000C7EF97E|nr:YraN family protein [Kandeliimicrobium roseum]